MRISSEYKTLLNEHHQKNPRWGSFGEGLIPFCRFVDKYNIKRVLDYGCGKGKILEMRQAMFDELWVYDPGYSQYDLTPTEPYQGVICVSVMEHVEEECVEDVLEHIRSLTEEYAFFYIATKETGNHLPDGRDTHITIKTPEEWISLLTKYFSFTEISKSKGRYGSFWFVGEPREIINN